MKVGIVLLALCCLSATIRYQGLAQIMVNKATKVLGLNAQQRSNALAIMTECMAFTTDPRQLSYVLSTAWGESNITPIKEYRANAGTYLYDVQNEYWYSGFYGRGYVQLTWKDNYANFGRLLGVDLVNNPDKALDPAIAGKIICIGMAKGLFTGVGLGRYLSSSLDDWYNARRIVNGVDKAQEFGNRGKQIFDTPRRILSGIDKAQEYADRARKILNA